MQAKQKTPFSNDVERLYYGRHRLTFRAGTYLALIRMMGIAHLVTALYGHTQLARETHARLARTRQTLRSLICHGFDSPEGRGAIERLRAAHQHLRVQPQDFRYVLATFFLEPLRWNEAHAKTPLAAEETALLLAFWMRVGEAMNIPDLPSSLPAWRQLQREYEARHMGFTDEGHRLAAMCLRDVVKLSVPRGARWAFRRRRFGGCSCWRVPCLRGSAPSWESSPR